jgi:hypothetical protein
MPSNTRTLNLPSFKYGGFDIPALELSTALIHEPKRFELACELAAKSAPLAVRVGLYQVGRDLSLGRKDAKSLPRTVKDAGKLVYYHSQTRNLGGTFHNDAVLLVPRSETPKGMRQMPPQWDLARYFQNIRGFKERDNDFVRLDSSYGARLAMRGIGVEQYDIDPLPQTTEQYVWLPRGGGWFCVPTSDGTYHPVGTPLETVENRDEAVKRWMEAGFTKKQAIREISRFHRTYDHTLTAVFSESNTTVTNEGPLHIDLNYEPYWCSLSSSSLAAKMFAERSEAPTDSGSGALKTQDEYRASLTGRKMFESIRRMFGR